MSLSKKHCQPCSGDEKPLTPKEITQYHQQVSEWSIDQDAEIPQLVREFELKNFMAVINFVNKIAHIAEEEQHHPNLYINSYKQLKIEIYTHKTEGLHVNDFILASKIDELWRARK